MILNIFYMMWFFETYYKIVEPQYIGQKGSTIALPCNVSDWNTEAISLMLWYKNKQRVPFYSVDAREVSLTQAKRSGLDDRVSLNETSVIPHLVIQNATDEDEGEYRCRVDYRDDKTQHSVIFFKIFDVPKLWIKLGAKINPDTIREGIDVILECNLISKLPVTEVNWYHNNNLVTNDLANGVLVFNHSLVLQRVKKVYRGHYQCSAANSIGEAKSEPFFLRIQFPPMCRPNQRQVYSIAHDEEAVIRCELDSDPEPSSFQWRLNNTQGIHSIMHNFTLNGNQSVFRYTPRNKLGYGSIFCTSSNEIGQQQEPCQFKIIPSSVPEKVNNCSVKNQTLSSLLVTCIPGPSNGMNTKFILEAYKGKGSTIGMVFTLSNQEYPTFVLDDLAPEEQYDLRIFAKTSGGQSVPVNLMASLEAAKMSHNKMKNGSFDEGDERGYSPVFAIFLAIVSIILLFAITTVIFIRRKANRLVDSSGDENISTPKGGTKRIYLSEKRDQKMVIRSIDNPDLMPKSPTNCDIMCSDKCLNYDPIDPTFGTIFKPFHGSLFDAPANATTNTDTELIKSDHLSSPPRTTINCDPMVEQGLEEEIRLHALYTRANPECRPRISLISETCNQLLPDRDSSSIQLDGCPDSELLHESPVMKNLRISCDGSEVTISFQLPRDQVNPIILNDNRTTPV
ncbi:neogenin-like [Brevipalpus obovatus]|uniref:neogenin-like n=1 Tax=Brevipalpus obovatus TaxID=246614 RepID=UPI003D9DE5DA